MTCTKCGEKPKKACGAFPKAVIEIDNPEQIVLIRKVLVPASMGDESTFPPTIGKYHNVLLEYEASGGIYLYSSDGIPTKLSSDVTELQAQLNALRVRIGEEEVARADADTALSNRITSLDDSLATVAKTGSYNDLTNKPTIGNATLTIKRNGTNVGTFTANATTNKSIDIAVPTKTSDLTNDGSDGTSTYVEADELPTVDRVYSASSNNAIANSTVTNSLNRDVMTNLALDTNPSTTTINLKNVKTNLANPSSSTTTSIPLPVASSTQAGVMNSATFDAVTNNTNNINAIMNGAVAISNLPASPTQAQLTTAWENETGLTSLINRASVYDVTNNKVWTYYTNDQTWHAASNTSQVTVNTFTNSSEGTIKGSTNDGQVFAENDGTGSVNGWDTLTGNVASNTSKLATIEQGAEVNVQANWTQTDVTADDYIKNKPTIPTVNNATLTIQKNGTNVQTFTANSSTNKTANITVPTAVSELTNDSGYATTTQLNNGLATKQDTLTAGDNIQINGNTISATDTTYTAGNAIDITNGEISADIHPADFFTASDSISDCGSNLSLDNTIASTLRSVELKGDTYQQTYSGKNLLNCNIYSGKAPAADALTGEGYVKVTQNTGSGGGNSFAYYDIDRAALANQQVTLFAKAVSGGGSTGSRIRITEISGSPEIARSFPTASGESTTFTIPADGKIRIYFYINASNVPGVVGAYTEYSEVQLELGAQATSFEPYVGGIPAPNPDYPQDIQVVTGGQTVTVTGKNLFPTVSQTSSSTGITIARNSDGTYNISGTATSEFNAISWVEDLSAFADGQTYTLSVSEQVGDLLVLVDMYNGSTWLRSFPRPSGTTLSRTAALDLTNATKMKFSLRVQSGKTVDLTNLAVQFEKGTATDYQPYQSQSYPISLGSIELCKIGDYQDYIYKSGDDWYVHKEIGKMTLDGLDWSTQTTTTSGVRRLWGAYIDNFAGADPNSKGDIYCSHYVVRSNSETYTSQMGISVSPINSAGYVIIYDPNYNTSGSVDAFETWLSENTVWLYYAMETPTDTQITNTVLVAQLNALAEARSYNDQTNITVTATGENLPATLCVEAYRKSLSGVIEAIDSACTCEKKATHLVLSNPTTATWNRTGTIGTVYPTSASVSIDTFASTDVVFTKDDGTTMTVGDLYTALTNGKSFEIDLPFGEINSTCYYGSDEAAVVATVENAKLDGSSKQTLDQTSQGRLSEMYTSSVPVAVSLSVPGGVLLDERFGVEHLMIDDGNTMTSSYRFVVNTYSYHEPFN